MIDRNRVKAKASENTPRPRWDEHAAVLMSLLTAESEEEIDRLLPAFPKAYKAFRKVVVANKQPGKFINGGTYVFRDSRIGEALDAINSASRESFLSQIAPTRQDLTDVADKLVMLNIARHVVRSNTTALAKEQKPS
jgi:hypothetical protein